MGNYSKVETTAREYYNSKEADNFYFQIWGGEDIHIGLYENEDDIYRAGRLTVEKMCSILTGLEKGRKVLDLGAGYGGSARHIAGEYDSHVTCLNISETQNSRNVEKNRKQQMDHLVDVVAGSFESIPSPDNTYDVVWSQDAFLHSGNRKKVLEEAYRVLKPGGELIFTDPMQSDDADPASLRPVLERIHLDSMGSFGWYTKVAEGIGFKTLDLVDLSGELVNHYSRVLEDLEKRNDEIIAISGKDYVERMKKGLRNWIVAGETGNLSWGILHFRK